MKILEAMALGTPVVSTRKGAEGLDLPHPEALLVADTPDGFVGEVLALLGDPERRARQSRLVREAVRAYDWRSLGDLYLQLVEDVIGERAGLVARH